MVFKRRKPRTYYEAFSESLYPRGGWHRAAQYIVHRLRRLPDPAHKISRGIAAGVFACFTPFFGLHFVLAAMLAFVMRGNIMAALLATFFGNPLTFPIIAAVSMELGNWMLGLPHIPLYQIAGAFSDAAVELWRNFMAAFTAEPTRWGSLSGFFRSIFLPYRIATAIAAYFLTEPVLHAYQKARVARLKKRFARKRERVVSRRIEMEGSVRDGQAAE